MKTIPYFILILISLNGFCQYSGCNVPQELRDAYEFDVSQLALTRILETNSTYKDSISIPIVFKDTIWDGLAAIFNTFTIPERDSVFDIYCVHNENCNGYALLIGIEVDTQLAWTDNWQNLIIQTGISELDSLLSEFNFDIIDFYVDQAILRTYTFINLTPFLDSLETFNGIINAGDVELTCCHNEIFYEKIANLKFYTFELNFDPHIFFCGNHYIWKFEVDDQCNADLIESQHLMSDTSVLAPIQNCNITSVFRNEKLNKDNFVSIYPNPTTDKITITADGIKKIEVLDITGKHLTGFGNLSGLKQIDLSQQPQGIYIIKVTTDKQTIAKKIIKQ